MTAIEQHHDDIVDALDYVIATSGHDVSRFIAAHAAVDDMVAEVKRLTAERDSLKGLLSGSQTELRDAVAAWGKAERERDAIKAERDGYRQQLDTDWQARQITDLTAMVGHAHRERDEARAALDRVRERADGWDRLHSESRPEDRWDRGFNAARGAHAREIRAVLDGGGT